MKKELRMKEALKRVNEILNKIDPEHEQKFNKLMRRAKRQRKELLQSLTEELGFSEKKQMKVEDLFDKGVSFFFEYKGYQVNVRNFGNFLSGSVDLKKNRKKGQELKRGESKSFHVATSLRWAVREIARTIDSIIETSEKKYRERKGRQS